MSLRVRYQYSHGASLAYSIERMADGYNYDFSTSTFKATTPTTLTAALTESTLRPGIYAATLVSTPANIFPDGNYTIYVVDAATGTVVVALPDTMAGGDDNTVPSAGGTATIDPRIEAFLIGKVTVDAATGKETFYAKDDPTTTVMRAEPDGSGGRIVVDLRGT